MALSSEESIRKFHFSEDDEDDLVEDPDNESENDEGEEELNPNFQFKLQSNDEDEAISPWSMQDALAQVEKPEGPETTTIDEKIEARLKRKRKQSEKESEKKKKKKKGEEEESSEVQNGGSGRKRAREEEEEEEEEQEDEDEVREKKIFSKIVKGRKFGSWDDLKLSRPLTKAIGLLNYAAPTPIQVQAVPAALQGHDLVCSAITGSGKTAAFALPILERLLHRDRRVAATRVLVLSPTRELAVQTHSVINALAQFTDVRACLVVGGLSMQKQQTELRACPDIVVGTPGRVIDHLRNSLSFSLEHVEILVLDEADRLLDLGFMDEIKEIVSHLPLNRQTLLFSATMTEAVDQLAAAAMRSTPMRISVDDKFELNPTLTQEFIKVRSSRAVDKEAMLLSLCTRVYTSHTIIFCDQKRTAHRLRVLFGLFKLRASELHGNLSQTQRLEALDSFRQEKIDFLICTDLAARGLDILGIRTVINFDMPRNLAAYVHRVGRTARAGKDGRAVSFVSEPDRKLLKRILKQAKQSVKQRVIAHESVEKWRSAIEKVEQDIEAILQQEKEERELRIAERDTQKAINMLEHRDEILARPPKSWFQSNAERKKVKELSKEKELRGGEEDEKERKRKEKQQKKKEKRKEKAAKKQKKEEENVRKAQRLAARQFKKSERQAERRSSQKGGKGRDGGKDKASKGKQKSKRKKGGLFESELGRGAKLRGAF